MDEETKKVIKERYEALPESIQEFIISDYYQEALMELGQKHQLNIEQLGIIEREVTMVLMGLINSKDFERELTRELRVDREKGKDIAQDVSDKVFLKVRELLKLMNTPAGENPVVEETADPLKSAGIEITPSRPKVEFQTPNVKNDREEVLKKVENPELLKPERELPAGPSIHEQKLAGSFVIPKKETSYEEKKPAPKPASGSDPYREPIN